MEYDLIMWGFMVVVWLLNFNTLRTSLPALILISNAINIMLYPNVYGLNYYLLEGVRHTSTIVVIYYLFIKERYIEYYFSYFLVYIGITTLYLTGLFVVLSDIDIDTIGVALNTLEFMVFIYGILFIKSHPSCSDSR